MIGATRRWFRRHRNGIAIGVGVVGAGYLAGQYVLSKISETRERMSSERIARENLRRRFEQNQTDCTFTVLALLPTAAENILEALPVEELTKELQQKKAERLAKLNAGEIPVSEISSSGAPSATEDDGRSLSSLRSEGYLRTSQVADSSSGLETPKSKSRTQLWNDLKINSLTRSFTLIYTLSLLTLLTRIQLNLLGRRNYLSSVVSLASPPQNPSTINLEDHDDEGIGHAFGNDFETNRYYLTFSWWLLHRGWRQLMEKVKEAVEEVFGPVNPREDITQERLSELTLAVRKKVEGATEEERRSTKWLSYLLPSRDQEDYVLKESGVLSASETSPLQNPSSLRHLLDETSDLIDSPPFTQILTLLNNEAFSTLIDNKCAIEAFKSTTTPTHEDQHEQQEPQHFSSSVTLTQTTYASPSTPGPKAKLATILAVIARQAHAIGNGTEPPNEYLTAMEQGVRELEAFAAVVYSSNFFDAKLPVSGSNPEGGPPSTMAATNDANATNDNVSSRRNSPGFAATAEVGGFGEGKEGVVEVGGEESVVDLGRPPSADDDATTPSFEKVWGKAVEEQQQQDSSGSAHAHSIYILKRLILEVSLFSLSYNLQVSVGLPDFGGNMHCVTYGDCRTSLQSSLQSRHSDTWQIEKSAPVNDQHRDKSLVAPGGWRVMETSPTAVHAAVGRLMPEGGSMVVSLTANNPPPTTISSLTPKPPVLPVPVEVRCVARHGGSFGQEPAVMASSAANMTATASPTPTVRATPQGGIFDHSNPSKYDPKNPITLFIIQAALIIMICRALHYPLSKIRQPRVISEVVGGIILGPSVMGRIPGFQEAIFPEESIPNLNLVANIGLVLYLFMIGVETNMRSMLSNWKVAVSVSAAGMILPFGLGCAVAYGLYHEFRDDPELAPISFGTYMLFIGIAMAITAFPVLCRILTELELLNTTVGEIVLSAGVGNDIVGWILLALCVALVNASTGLTALWVLLTCVAFVLFLTFAVRPVFLWYLKRTGSLHNGPDQSVVALTLLLALGAAFFTQVIGVHAIFGGFLVGLICPHEGGFAIKTTEKIEDLIGAVFLPLYFALSGLNTNIGLLDTGITWGYVVAVIVIAFAAKVAGGMFASRLNGLVWRESAAIGVLMSCKGLVELIVLNIGLQARILSRRTFTIFVVMALATTFATTPLTLYLYPEYYRDRMERWRRGEIDWDGNEILSESDPSDSSGIAQQKARGSSTQKFLVYLRLDNLAGLFTFVSLLGLGDDSKTPSSKVHHRHEDKKIDLPAKKERPVEVHGLRLIELTDRDSSVMKVSEARDYSFSDPILNTFRTFSQLNTLTVSGAVVISPEHAYAETIVNRARDLSSDFILLPWSETGGMSEHQITLFDDKTEKFSTGPHSAFVSSILKNAKCPVGVFINKGFGGPQLTRPQPGQLSRSISGSSIYKSADITLSPALNQGHHIFFPYFGGADDKVALRLVLQLAKNSAITATIVHVDTSDEVSTASSAEGDANAPSTPTSQDKDADNSFFNALRDSLPEALTSRVIFQDLKTTPTAMVTAVLDAAKADVGKSKDNTGDLVIVGRTNVATAALTSAGLSSGEMGSEAKRALGVFGEAMAATSNAVQASVIVVQAGPNV
ncbi:peroxin-3 [Blastomyces parvus]|uniref:Peroxin-3 n=1 Tax=Blastomyces parvus TaxID=2060905 RepID=A0A2B7XI41_9EURO|nr:peroxin-3 [Blastomyces parvus]